MDDLKSMAPPAAPPPAVRLQGLVHAWSASGPRLRVPGFEVAAGEAVFLQGRSGSGKSTLLALIAGVLSPREGRLQVLGQELTALNTAQRDRLRGDHLGIVFQQFNLLPYLSALGNVLLPVHLSARRAQRAGPAPQREALRLLQALHIDAGAAARPAAQLSVGQQQRVAAARALIGRPGLVLADEPTSALDAATCTAFVDLLREACRQAGAALVFVSHDLALQDRFDRSVRIDEVLHWEAPAWA